MDIETFELHQVHPIKTSEGTGAGTEAGSGAGAETGTERPQMGPPGSSSSGTGSHGTREGFWPRSVKNHSLSSVDDRYVLCFGGRYPGSEGQRCPFSEKR